MADVEDALVRIGLRRDGPVISTHASLACPVVLDGRPAFLKVSNAPEELAGARALASWGGCGAVEVLASDGNAIVLERAGRTLRSLARSDVVATHVLCDVAGRLHEHTPEDLGEFPTLRTWFCSLFADTSPGFDLVRSIADQLLEHARGVVLLHGDLHHDNVLDSTARGWLAIDPKGIAGPREFEYCNIFTNWTPQQAHRHFDSRIRIVAHRAGIEVGDLLRWVAAWSALSGIWHLEDENAAGASFPHSITRLALDRLREHDLL